MSDFNYGGPVTSAAAAQFTVGADEVLIQRVSVHCAKTPHDKHKLEPCDADATPRSFFGGWTCECECHT